MPQPLTTQDTTQLTQGKGWLFQVRVKDAKELGALMDAAAYKAFATTCEH